MPETRDTILVLGTGATRGGKFRVRIGGHQFQPPLDRKFFSTSATQSIFNAKDYPALYHYWQSWQEEKSLESTWSKVDLYYKLCNRNIIEEKPSVELREDMLMKGEADPSYRAKYDKEKDHPCLVPSLALWEILNLTREVYRDLVLPVDDSPLRSLACALRDNDRLMAAITFNYDTSLEETLNSAGIQYYWPDSPVSKFDRPPRGDALLVLKLHGSLGWQTDTRTAPPIGHAPLCKKAADIGYVDAGCYYQPEIIGPTFFKQEITMDTRDIRQDFRAVHYEYTWREARRCLGKVKNLVFVGFSFPQTDFHAAALFRNAHMNGKGFTRIVVCHKGKAKTVETIQNIFSGRTDNPPQFLEFDDGLKGLVARNDELLAFLKRPG